MFKALVNTVVGVVSRHPVLFAFLGGNVTGAGGAILSPKAAKLVKHWTSGKRR